MFAQVVVTLMAMTACIVLGVELIAFWHDRTVLGNVIITAANIYVLTWFWIGVRGLWE